MAIWSEIEDPIWRLIVIVFHVVEQPQWDRNLNKTGERLDEGLNSDNYEMYFKNTFLVKCKEFATNYNSEHYQ